MVQMGIPRKLTAFFLRRTRYLAGSLARAPLAFLLLSVSLGTTYFGWQYSRDVVERLASAKFHDEMKQIETGIVTSLGFSEHELYGARGFFDGSEDVTRDEWRRYSHREDIERFSSVTAVGFAERVPRDKREVFIESIRADRSVKASGYPRFAIRPPSDAPESIVVKYVVPEPSNLGLLGLDLSADPIRAEVLADAGETGRVTSTPPRRVIRNRIPTAVFDMYLAVYSGPETNAAGRREGLRGYVFETIDIEQLMRDVYRDRAGFGEMDVEIFDGEVLAAAHLVHDRIPDDLDLRFLEPRRFSSHAILNVAGRVWSVRFSSNKAGDALQDAVPMIVLVAGLGLSFLLFGVLYSLVVSRATALKLSELASLVESSEDAVIGLSLSGVILSWNPAAQRIYGYTADEIVGRQLSTILPHESAREAEAILERIRKEGRIPYYESRRIGKEGRCVLVSSTVSAIRDIDGKIKGISTIDRDITHLVEVQKRLDLSKEYYLTMFEEFPAMIWRSRHDGRRDYFNKTWALFTGREPAAEMEDAWIARIHPDDAENYMKAYRAAHHERRAFEIEYRHRRSDDKFRWLADHGIPFRGLDGQFSGFIGFSLDVTDRKKSDADLRHSLDLLFSIIDNIPDMIFLKEAGELRFELFNKAGEDLIGIKREEMIGKNDYDLFPRDQADFFTQKDYEVLRDKKMMDIPEETIQTRLKGQRVLHTKKVPILPDDKSQPGYLLGISEDITDRKRAEADLRDSEQRLRAILDHSPAVVYLKDLDGGYLFVNRQFEELFHVKRDELVGKSDLDLFRKKTAEALRENDRKVLQSGAPIEFEEIVENDGRAHTYISIKFPLLSSDGKPYALCGISTDITGRKNSEARVRQANEELVANDKKLRKALFDVARAHDELKKAQSQLIRAEKFAAIGKLAGIVSHEFRNQLGVIRNAAYFIKMRLKDPDEKIARHLSILEKEIDETDRIIENILSFARKNKPELKPVSVIALLEKSIERAERPEGVERVWDIQPDLGRMDADEVLLGRVFLNIAMNAYQAIKPPGFFTVSAERSESAITMRFKDTGVGIEPKDLPHIFDPLFSMKTHGTGLGLATSKVLVEAHGGTIELSSKVGEGTLVVVRLPVSH